MRALEGTWTVYQQAAPVPATVASPRELITFLVWLDVRATGFADVEIAVTGREIDAPGAERLITTVAEDMRQVRPQTP